METTKLISRNEQINFLMKSGLFDLATLQRMDPAKLETLFEAGLEATGFKEKGGCPFCGGRLKPINDKPEDQHFQQCNNCGNAYNVNYNPPQIYYRERKLRCRKCGCTNGWGLEKCTCDVPEWIPEKVWKAEDQVSYKASGKITIPSNNNKRPTPAREIDSRRLV